MNDVTVIRNTPKAVAVTLMKGRDGTVWYVGTPDGVGSCKTGDFCFDPDSYDLFRYSDGAWGLLCNINNLDRIEEFIDGYTGKIEAIISQVTDSPCYKPWWFGTREEYNAMTAEQRAAWELHFIEEGS